MYPLSIAPKFGTIEKLKAQTPPPVLECAAVIIGGVPASCGAGRRGPAGPARSAGEVVAAGEGPAGGRRGLGVFAFCGRVRNARGNAE